MIYRNNKHGTLYHIITLDAVDCTNNQNGKRMVIYTKEQTGRLKSNETYCREYKEFMEKFTLQKPVENNNG